MSSVRVLVVDDQRLIREGIASLLELQEGVMVCGTAADGREAVDLAQDCQPDVVLMDVRMPVMDGIAATAQLKRELPECQVLMLTTFDDDEYIVRSLQAGACGYLLKDIPAADLAQALQLAHAGVYQLAPSVAGKLVGQWAAKSKSSDRQRAERADVDLTERELDVLRLVATGATNREIAGDLCVSEGTVKNYVSRILSRLGLRDRIQAALYAHDHDLA